MVTEKGTMEQAASFSLKSIAPTIAELERAALWFTQRNNLRELGDQHHTVMIATGPRPAKCNGWFKGKRIETDNGKPNGKPTGNVLFPWYSKTEDGSEGVLEIMLTGEYLNRPVDKVIETLFHEVIHAVAESRGIQDTATSGRHNKRFAELCESMEMACEQDDKGSWNITTMLPGLAEAVVKDFQPNAEAFQLAASMFQIKPKSEAKLAKYVCGCETGIQRKGAEFRTYRAAILHGQCYDCKQDFQKSD